MSDSEIKNNQENQDRSGAGAVKKTAAFLSRATGISSARKNIEIIKHRASFPLLRRVLSNELSTAKSKPAFIPLSDLSEEDRDRSYFWHTIIVAVTIPALIWTLLIMTKGLALGIKYDLWNPITNQGLYTSIPMTIFIVSKLYVSWRSRIWFKEISNLPRQES